MKLEYSFRILKKIYSKIYNSIEDIINESSEFLKNEEIKFN